MTVLVCIHRWLLEMPHGPTVAARCQVCGETREYPSTIDYDEGPWGTYAAKGAAAASARRASK